MRRGPEPDRKLLTVLFTDIVDSTARAADLGDQRWKEILSRHDAIFRKQLQRFRGHEIKSTGDGFLAVFDGPTRAIRCAIDASEQLETLGLEIRMGIHSGECEQRGDDIGGIAVHIASRIVGKARPGETLVSSTVTHLVVGSGIAFDARGEETLKGVPGSWQLFAVQNASGVD